MSTLDKPAASPVALNGARTNHSGARRSLRVVLFQNASSGRGAAKVAVGAVAKTISRAGHEIITREVGPRSVATDLEAALAGADVLLIAGGDGTVHHALPLAIKAGVPICQFPMGTENLFSREFAMSRSPEKILASLERGVMRTIDLASCNDRLFAIMCSVGFDARVVQRIASVRTSTISKVDYVVQGLREMTDFRPTLVSIEIDGQRVVDDQPGLAVVANIRQYAARLDPAREALPDDGLLDVVFYPHRSRTRLIGWGLATAMGRHARNPELVRGRGTHIRLTIPEDAPHQLDGEHAGNGASLDGGLSANSAAALRTLDIRVVPSALRVVVP